MNRFWNFAKKFVFEIIPVIVTGMEPWSEPKNKGIEGLKRDRNGEANCTHF
ncbi:DEHA2G23364p [Debaryomyces hansenii CBS767]|jgi:hypothetical protein|uniref:DEHA2G23364p n=1 Tax=Debaryomyces hansenii (strain ATCC 36239 / CBS 767 / BCRC 21394 / JCM 1990 / NBRC 0083 / IGC 2968) TaxID=284592 RepID=Q6BGW5_DEBHA|nr:DEHA2G23364p [Debaryomyces hansenii CBS767]CAG91067.1 DEHA2G23364p [Debaryomyces hansenii CBS767]|eukprot:XP_462556.1 DEHA2G23364p [Debaryomyces hansenii CBS767]